MLWPVHFKFALQGCRSKRGEREVEPSSWEELEQTGYIYEIGFSRVADYPKSGICKMIESESWKNLRNHGGLNHFAL